MSTSTKPKAKRRSTRARYVPLLMLGSDGEMYACTSTENLPEGALKNQHAVLAVRLTRRERDIALDSLQEGVEVTARLLSEITGKGRRYDA